MSSSTPLTFSGTDSEDVTVFLQGCQSEALAQGRQRDDGWIADCVGARLQGAALKWYYKLDEDVQGSWRMLRVAMVERFDGTGSSPSTPPATSGSVLPSYEPQALQSLRGSETDAPPYSRRGRIKLVKLNGVVVGYLSKGPKWNDISRRQTDALLIEIPGAQPANQSPWELKVVNAQRSLDDDSGVLVYGRRKRHHAGYDSWTFSKNGAGDGSSDPDYRTASKCWKLRNDGMGSEDLLIMWNYIEGGAEALKAVKTSGIIDDCMTLRAKGYSLARNETEVRMVFEEDKAVSSPAGSVAGRATTQMKA